MLRTLVDLLSVLMAEMGAEVYTLPRFGTLSFLLLLLFSVYLSRLHCFSMRRLILILLQLVLESGVPVYTLWEQSLLWEL